MRDTTLILLFFWDRHGDSAQGVGFFNIGLGRVVGYGYFVKDPPTTTQGCHGVINRISSHFWEWLKCRVISETLGLRKLWGNTINFGLPAT